MSSTLHYKGYDAAVTLHAEDEIFSGRVLGIRDLIVFEGESPAALQAAFKEAVDDYLAYCKQAGRKPEQAFKGQFQVRIEPEIHRLLALYAQEKDESLNKGLSDLLKDFFMSDSKTLKNARRVAIKKGTSRRTAGAATRPKKSTTQEEYA